MRRGEETRLAMKQNVRKRSTYDGQTGPEVFSWRWGQDIQEDVKREWRQRAYEGEVRYLHG